MNDIDDKLDKIYFDRLEGNISVYGYYCKIREVFNTDGVCADCEHYQYQCSTSMALENSGPGCGYCSDFELKENHEIK